MLKKEEGIIHHAVVEVNIVKQCYVMYKEVAEGEEKRLNLGRLGVFRRRSRS